MNTDQSRLTLHMVSSLDGIIAKKNGSVDWMTNDNHYEEGITLSQEFIDDYLNSIDCYLMGSKTYEHALKLGWPYGNKPVFVMTTRALKSDHKNVEFISGNLDKIVNDNLKLRYKNIWLVGGSELTKQSMNLKLVDDIVISIVPIILGDGLPFFNQIKKDVSLKLKDVKAYKDGMVELSYNVIK